MEHQREATGLLGCDLFPGGSGLSGGRREAYFSTKHPPPCQEAWLPRSHEHPSGPCRAQEPSRQGPRPPLGLILRIRDRQSFQRLSRDGKRIRRASLWCTWCPNPDPTGMAVAFAVGRALAPAVTRNRLRRRFRAILRELDQVEPLPPCLLLIGATPRTLELTFEQMRMEVRSMVDQIRLRVPLEPVAGSA